MSPSMTRTIRPCSSTARRGPDAASSAETTSSPAIHRCLDVVPHDPGAARLHRTGVGIGLGNLLIRCLIELNLDFLEFLHLRLEGGNLVLAMGLEAASTGARSDVCLASVYSCGFQAWHRHDVLWACLPAGVLPRAWCQRLLPTIIASALIGGNCALPSSL